MSDYSRYGGDGPGFGRGEEEKQVIQIERDCSRKGLRLGSAEDAGFEVTIAFGCQVYNS